MGLNLPGNGSGLEEHGSALEWREGLKSTLGRFPLEGCSLLQTQESE